MKLIDREPTPEMLRAMGAEVRGGSWSMTAIFNAAYDAAPEIQQEPVAFYCGRNQFGSPAFRSSNLPTTEGPLYTFPPDAQVEIAKRDARIKELEAIEEQRDVMVADLYEKRGNDLIKLDEQAARIAKLEQDLQTTADALGHAHLDIERLERESSACDLLEEQKGTIKALNWALGGEDSTSTENLIDAHEVNYADEGLIALCRKLTQENVRLEDVVLCQKKAWTADFEELERLRDQLASSESSPVLNRVKAEALRDAADEFDAQGEWKGHGQQLRNMADAIEKGEGL